jgi:hypothetical protein
MKMIDLNLFELQQINGGSKNYEMGHDAGEYVGQLVGQVIKGVLLLRGLYRVRV